MNITSSIADRFKLNFKTPLAEAYYNERKPLLEQAAQWGFDASGMSNAEIDAKISELLKSPHDFPTSENGN